MKHRQDIENPILDKACGGNHAVKIYFDSPFSIATEFAQVNILLMKNKKVRAIIEIEETRNNPVRIFGKAFAAHFARYFFNPSLKEPIEYRDILFIQIIVKDTMTNNKLKQFENIKEVINQNLRTYKGSIKEYEMIIGTPDIFEKENGEGIEKLKKLI